MGCRQLSCHINNIPTKTKLMHYGNMNFQLRRTLLPHVKFQTCLNKKFMEYGIMMKLKWVIDDHVQSSIVIMPMFLRTSVPIRWL